MVVVGKNIVEKVLHPDGMCFVGFCGDAIPEVVEFGKIGFEKEMGVDLEEGGGGAVAVIAGVDGDFFAEEVFDCGLENRRKRRRRGIIHRQQVRQVSECNICSCQTSLQRRSIKTLRKRDFFNLDSIFPKIVGDFGLENSRMGELGVFPEKGAVAGKLRVIAIPGWCTECTLCNVVVAFAVSAHEEHFVDGVGWRSSIHGFDVLFELLPLCERFCQIVCRFISSIDQAKIGQGLAGQMLFFFCFWSAVVHDAWTYIIEGGSVCGRIVLEKVSRNCGVIDVAVGIGCYLP